MNNILYCLKNKNLFLILLMAFTSMFVCGCTTTIFDKHNELIKNQPNRNHYATAVPFYSGANRNGSYANACIYYNSYPSHQRKAEWPYEWFSASGGDSQDAVETYAIKECEKLYNRTCIVILYNNTERCSANFENAYARDQLRLNQKREQEKLALETQKRNQTEEISSTCISFGFKSNTLEFSKCMLEMHNSLLQIEAMRNATDRQSSAIEAANAEAVKLREFVQSMRLLQIGAGMMSPQEQKETTCTYDSVMRRMKCR